MEEASQGFALLTGGVKSLHQGGYSDKERDGFWLAELETRK